MKNKEIEELLNKIKQQFIIDEKFAKDFHKTTLNYEETKLLLSYIEQLETDYKEANESVTWWTNRYNAIVKQNDDNHKKVVKLENNRDKAIKRCQDKQYETNLDWLKKFAIDIENILKGDSDEF